MRMSQRSALRHMLYELRGGFLLVPGVMMLIIITFGVGLIWVEEHIPVVTGWAERWAWTVPRDPTVAQNLLSAIAGSIMTVLSVVYSVLLLVLTFTSLQFSPRIIIAFMKDRVSQVTLGLFLGTFAFCLVTLPSIHTGPSPAVPTIAVSFAMLLAVVSLVWLVYFVHNMALSIQANRIVHRIAMETESVIKSLFRSSTPQSVHLASAPVEPGTPLPCPESGYIQFIDIQTLLSTARSHAVCIGVNRPVGQFVPKGIPLATVSPAAQASSKCRDAALRAFHIGAVRTMEDDVEFGVLQIVDVALKAISPAVNDPSTAIACIDHLSHILTCATTRKPPPEQVFDRDGVLRVTLKQTSFPRLLDMAFDQIAHYAKSDMAVCHRILRALNDVAVLTRERTHLLAIRACARRVYDLCTRHCPSEECLELTNRMALIDHHTAVT